MFLMIVREAFNEMQNCDKRQKFPPSRNYDIFAYVFIFKTNGIIFLLFFVTKF